jgi:hypothetical protein
MADCWRVGQVTPAVLANGEPDVPDAPWVKLEEAAVRLPRRAAACIWVQGRSSYIPL